MTCICLAALLQPSLVAPDAESYAEAYRLTTETGRPMVVLVGAEWCPACQRMKRDVLPHIRQRGLLREVSFAVVNLDHERELGRTLTRGGPIPQLLFFRKAPDGWRLSRLIGGQGVRAVEKFVRRGLQRDEASRAPASAPKEQPQRGGQVANTAPSAEGAPALD